MKLYLKNFLCYTDKYFEFTDNDMVLLIGPSGVGKTSILRAIFFALFGEGNKLQNYGKTSCVVEMEFDNIKIVRTKRPNRLVVNDIYEDVSAQAIINKKFGETFKTSGYIQQNNMSSFILMSPLEKLEFIEKFAFRDVDIASIKSKTKSVINQLNEKLICLSAKKDTTEKILEEMTLLEKVSFPIKCKVSQRQLAIKNTHTKIKNCYTRITKSEKAQKAINIEISDLRVYQTEIEHKETYIKKLTEKLQKVKEEICLVDYCGDDELEKYQNILDKIQKQKEVYDLQTKLTEQKEKLNQIEIEEEKDFRCKITEIKSTLWAEYKECELKETIQNLLDYQTDMKKVSLLKSQKAKICIIPDKHASNIEKVDEYTKIINGKNSYKCPECSSMVFLQDGELHPLLDNIDMDEDHDIEDIKRLLHKIKIDIESYKKKESILSDIEEEISSITSKYDYDLLNENVIEDIKYLKSYLRSQIALEAQMTNLSHDLEHKRFSASYQKFKADTNRIKSRLDKMKGVLEENIEEINMDELKSKIQHQEKLRDSLILLQEKEDELEDDISTSQSSLQRVKAKHIEKYKSVSCIQKLNDDIDTHENFILVEKDNLKNNLNLIEKIKEWESYEICKEKYNNRKKDVIELTNEEDNCRRKYTAALQLKEKISEAESIAMSNIIQSINIHAKVYLESFFVDNPICVELKTFKETKKSVKPKINVSVIYKGNDCELTMLSGGELSRVVLAYTLSLAEIFNTPLLLLDECTASLDQDLTNIVFTSIKENFNGKMILIIAHQVVTGIFDKVLTLE